MTGNLHLAMDEFLPLRDVVFNTLRQAILTGELKPGERLMEIHLANKLGVSRTPIREAIRKLELEGLVTMIPRRGAELACARISDEEVEALGVACKEFEEITKTGDIRAIATADVALHDIIIKATGNRRLGQLVNNLAEQMYRYRFEYIKDKSVYARLIEEHRIMYDAIRAKDQKTAAKVAVTHIDNQMEAIARQLNLE